MTVIRRRMWWLLVAVALTPIGSLFLLSDMASRPANLGLQNGRLAACPKSPNCVSTQADDQGHRIEPLAFQGSASDAMQRLKDVIGLQPNLKIITETESYLHVEAVSRLFRFVDDLEFLVDEPAGVIHFRSASRVGYSDFGVNRARMERIRSAWIAEP